MRIDDREITSELEALAPPTAPRSEHLQHTLDAMNDEARMGRRGGRRRLATVGLVTGFTLVGATAAIAAPAIQGFWQPDDRLTYESEVAGHCVIAVLNESASFIGSAIDAEQARAISSEAMSSLDLGTSGLAQMVRNVRSDLDEVRDSNGMADGIDSRAGLGYLALEHAASLSAADFEEAVVSSVLLEDILQRFADAGWHFEGRLNVTCDGASK